VGEYVGFNVPLDTQQVTSETSLSRLHWYWQPKTRKENTTYTQNTKTNTKTSPG